MKQSTISSPCSQNPTGTGKRLKGGRRWTASEELSLIASEPPIRTRCCNGAVITQIRIDGRVSRRPKQKTLLKSPRKGDEERLSLVPERGLEPPRP
jgi:hypothetical protein